MLSMVGTCRKVCGWVLVLCVLCHTANAQTPWAAAPASPAALPPAASAAKPVGQISSLSPPPPRTSWPSTGITTPAHVPLAQSTSAGLGALTAGLQNIQTPPVPKLAVPALPQLTVLPQTRAQTVSLRVPGPSSIALPNATGQAGTTRMVAYTPGQDAQEKLESGQLIAVVGEEHILAGDMSVFVEPVIQQNKSRIDTPEKEAMARAQLTRQVLKEYISIKANYQEFFRDAVGNKPPDEIIAVKEKVIPNASKAFFKMQVPVLLEKYDAVSIADLERKLAEKSLSLRTMRKQFIEQALGAEYERKYIPRKFEVDHRELLEYYREHEAEWNMPGRAKWRQVTIRFDEHDKATAKALIDNLLKQIYLGGKSFAEVAKQDSEGYTADEGGLYDWTTKGSLKSAPLNNAIFALPMRQLSGVIEDASGFHFIEVLEREQEHIKSFPDAQPEIRKIIVDRKRQEAREKLREKVLARTPVWTRWPEDLPGLPLVRKLDDALAIP